MARRVMLAVALAAGVFVAVASGDSGARHRAWSVSVAAPAPSDLSVASVRFAVGPRRPSLRLALADHAVGGDYVAAAALRAQRHGALAALVVVIRLPSAGDTLDPVSVSLTARLSRPLRAPAVGSAVDPYTHGVTSPSSVCAAVPEGTLSAARLRALMEVGQGVPGFSARAAVAEGFNEACGRTVDPAFTAAVHPTPATPTPTPTTPTTPTPIPPPTCPPCGPVVSPQTSRSQIACPLAERPSAVYCPQ